jgi:valyl-tRNA synthetase
LIDSGKWMAMELPKQYDPQEAQKRWLRFWDERGYFHSQPDPKREPFCIVIPPPNVTGALHLGHALNNTLQDVLIRWRRMQGYNALWVPGTDHAGIATQAVVERRILDEEGKTRDQVGREELVRRIWTWKDQYEARILRQLRELGCSCDWDRTRFTLDGGCVRAVRTTFFNFFRDGLICRGKRLVNWDVQLRTAVADDEIYHETVKGGFWTFRYPIKGSEESIRFSTTRPETMLGDTAVAVHPDDPRYRHLIGKMVTIPILGRDIPIIADAELVDPTLGTGAVKVTPAHDPNDYACGLRQKLPMINILTPSGEINANGGPYAGLDRMAARERVTSDMEALGFFEGREDRDIDLAHSDRSKTAIEPYLSDQWFVRMEELAQSAIDAVNDNRVKFSPARYAKTYVDWLSEKRDWCISRQLWWGHRIPIWYARCAEADLKKAFVKRNDVVWQRDEDKDQWLVCAMEDLPSDALGPKTPIEQDPDVLDTWFSSALWPHSTLGWPEDTPDLRYYYPTNVLVTSRGIITLWVARMVITGLFNMGKVPFHRVYITPTILDGFGETMSKSKGNGVDPMDIIETYGTDALRFGMVHLATETQDSRLPVVNICPHCGKQVPVRSEHMYMRTQRMSCPACKKLFRPGGPWPAEDPELPTAKQASDRFELGRNFATKLWNAARFLFMNMEGYRPGALLLEDLAIEDRWILSRLAATTANVTQSLEGFHFSDVARAIYDFTWSEFCDWYVEMSKGRLRDAASRLIAQRVLLGVLDAIVRMVHPIMPFVAESLWQALGEVAPERGLPAPERAAESVVIAPWPRFSERWCDLPIERRIGRLRELVKAIREIRNRYMIEPRIGLEAFVRCSRDVAPDLERLAPFVQQLAGVATLQFTEQKPQESAHYLGTDFEAYVSLKGLINVSEEIQRLKKQLAEKQKYLQSIERKLGDERFVAKAPAEVVQQQRDLLTELGGQIAAIEENLRELERQ